jgi:Squalene/phytoene synthase
LGLNLNMSDTANPGKLASSEEFDARLKRTDEDRWLATRYAPDAARELLIALYLMDQELRRALGTKEPMLGKIRIQWWRETVEQVAGRGPVRRHDLAEELARVTRERQDLIAPINDLIDRYDDIIDDHLHTGGHEAGGEHDQRHFAAEASLVRLAGLALDASVKREHLDALSRCGEASLALAANLPDAVTRWNAARNAARTLPPPLWPAVAHLAAARHPNKTTERSPLMKRLRMLGATLRRSL